MTGAVCFSLNENHRAVLYPAGAYDVIDWNSERPSELGEGFTACDFIADGPKEPSVLISCGTDGMYILRLVETRRYVLKIQAAGEYSDECNHPELPEFYNGNNNRFLKIEKDEDSIVFQFINYLGRSRMKFRKLGKEITFEVVPDKIDYEDDYIRLTESIADICSELLLDYVGLTSNRFASAETTVDSLLEQFIFMRKFCYGDNLTGLFEAIKRNPDRKLDSEEEFRPMGIGAPSKHFYSNPFSFSSGWTNISETAEGKGRFVPRVVAVSHKYDQTDTPANRFIKFALNRFDSICTALSDRLMSNRVGMQVECRREAEIIHCTIENILSDRFFRGIGDIDIMPQNNQVLQKRNGYSQIFSAFSMLDLALQLNWPGKDEVYEGESRNVALLYEYWLFLELFRVISSIGGCTVEGNPDNPFLMTRNNDVLLSLKQGRASCQSFEIGRYGVKANLYYNRTFSAKDFNDGVFDGSYSRPFRPDFTIAVFPIAFDKGKNNGESEALKAGEVSYIHFDAKYRITDLTDLFGKAVDDLELEEEMNDDKADSIISTYKRGDLLKMHTYNDAIRCTSGSYVLYPGNDDDDFRLYDEPLPGVGAFPIRPGKRDDGEKKLRDFLEEVFRTRGEISSRINRLQYYAGMVIDEPSASFRKNESEVCHNPLKKGDLIAVGGIYGEDGIRYYTFLREFGKLSKGSRFPFYFYAIRGQDVFSHHKDIFKAEFFCFHSEEADSDECLHLGPVLCRITSNELISRKELAERLDSLGHHCSEDDLYGDFYYVLNLQVESDSFEYSVEQDDIDYSNGNGTFSPYSPKVLCFNPAASLS